MTVSPPPEAQVDRPARPNSADPGVADPLTEAGFQALFDRLVRPALARLEAKRRRLLRRFWLHAAIACVGALGACLAFIAVSGEEFLYIPLTIGVAAVLILLSPLYQLGRRAKEDLLNAVTQALGFTYQLDGFDPPAWEELTDLGLLPRSDRQTFDDLFRGIRSGAFFAMCDAKLQQKHSTGKSDIYITVFRGQVMRIRVPQRFLGVTVFARDAGFFNRFRCPEGMKRVGLASSQFERDFEVYSTDQVEGRFLIHPAFMQKLLDMEAAFGGSRLRGVFCEHSVLLALQGRDRFRFGNPFKRFDDIEDARKVASDMAHLLRVIDFILMGPPRAPELGPA